MYSDPSNGLLGSVVYGEEKGYKGLKQWRLGQGGLASSPAPLRAFFTAHSKTAGDFKLGYSGEGKGAGAVKPTQK